MATMQEHAQVCPICSEATVRRVSCAYAPCSFFVTTCDNCDRPQVVAKFVADHEKDCACGPGVNLGSRPPTFVAPRRAA